MIFVVFLFLSYMCCILFVLGHPFSLHHGLKHHVEISSSSSSSSSNIYNILNNRVFIVFTSTPASIKKIRDALRPYLNRALTPAVIKRNVFLKKLLLRAKNHTLN